MRPGEVFERCCYEYLKKLYKTDKTDFYHEGGMDSTKSDIAVLKSGRIDFYIEAKDALAQSGQFVVLPEEERETFVFSPRNHSQPNEMTDVIIRYMNSDFQRFNHAGTAGQALEIDTSVFADWIIDHYKEKNVKYVISCDGTYVIFPIRRFGQYFEITANYRIKKSGSAKPAKKDIPAIRQMIQGHYTTARFAQAEKKLFADISEALQKDRFVLGRYTYYLSEQGPGHYEVRKLSNTYNMNVIFSIKLIKAQDPKDLEEFEADLSSSQNRM